MPAVPPSRSTRCGRCSIRRRCPIGCSPRASDLALETFDFATAHKLADRVLTNEPASGEARAQLARVLTAEGDAVAAIAISQEAAALDPETDRFAYADTLLRLDRMDEARQELDSLRADASVRDEADLRLGKLAYQMGDLTEAGRRFGSLISSPEAAGEAFFYLSSIAEREGRTDLALEGYSRLAEAGAGLIVRGRAARLLLKKDDRDAAFRMLDDHAAKERSEVARRGIRQGGAARGSRQLAAKPSRCCSWRSSVIPITRACVTRSR